MSFYLLTTIIQIFSIIVQENAKKLTNLRLISFLAFVGKIVTQDILFLNFQ